MTNRDIAILRELASETAEIAHLPVQEATRENWRALNARKPNCPMFMIDQIPWHEMDVDGELTNLCADPFCVQLETQLRRTLYRWKHLRADMVVEPCITVPIPLRGATAKFSGFEILNFGLSISGDIRANDCKNDVVSHIFHDQLRTEADLEKLRAPEISIDTVLANEFREKSERIFEGILPVRMRAMDLTFQLWDFLVEFHGAEQCLYDLIDRPEFIHAILEKMTQISLHFIDRFEQLALIEQQEVIHCTGAYTYDTPVSEPEKPSSAKNAWTFGMSQIFSSVSKEMHAEFEVPYLSRIFERFRDVYYGCCEPLHNKIDLIRSYKNVRKISVSPWADAEIAAHNIGKDYVLSRKPNPAFLAGAVNDLESSLREISDTVKVCSVYGTPAEYILKDISTVQYEPCRLWEWEKAVRNLLKN